VARALFYHLTAEPAEALLPVLIGKALEAGLRVAVRAPDPARIEALDLALWRGDGFLPHGVMGGPHDADQPALLVAGTVPAGALPNRPDCLIALDGAPIDPAEAAGLDRALVVFDGGDPAQLATARGQWRALTAAGIAAEYWNRDGGRWACKARHPA
jgi:DNA polymerase III subunit chi